MNSKQIAARDKMQAKIDARTTEELFSDLTLLDTYRIESPTMAGFMYFEHEEHRMIHAMMADTIEARHDLHDAMEEIFMADDYAGSYLDALKEAYARSLEPARLVELAKCKVAAEELQAELAGQGFRVAVMPTGAAGRITASVGGLDHGPTFGMHYIHEFPADTTAEGIIDGMKDRVRKAQASRGARLVTMQRVTAKSSFVRVEADELTRWQAMHRARLYMADRAGTPAAADEYEAQIHRPIKRGYVVRIRDAR